MQFTKKLFIALTFLTIFFTQLLLAQDQRGRGQGRPDGGVGGIGSVSGVVVDKQTLQAVEYANLVVYRTKDSIMVGGAITNQKGSFTIEKVPFGNYYLVVSFIGYKSLTIPNIMINPKEPEKKMGQIKFLPSSNTLNEYLLQGFL